MNRPSDSQPSPWNHWETLSLALGLLSLTACQSVPTPIEAGNSRFLPRTLSVSGKGEVTIPTTVAQVSLGVTLQGKEATEVQEQLAQKSSAVVKLLKARKVEKLETTNISFSPVYSYKDDKETLIGYSGTNIVRFRIETQKIANLLDDAIKAGATRIDSVRFVASDHAIAQAQQQAINKAAEDAKKQGDAALSALNLQQQEIMRIQINETNVPEPLSFAIPAKRVAIPQVGGIPSTPVVGGEQEVEASVTLLIRY